MASLQRAPGKKKWLPLAVAAIVAGVVGFSVLESTKNNTPSPRISTVTAEGPTSPNLSEAYELSSDGLYQEALVSIDQFLIQSPDDMDALLLKATVLLHTEQQAEAEDLLIQLRDSYPDRPEPLNNLAVLYAETGDNARAISTLQQAFQTHPSYAQVYRNLSDMYAVLASEAYNKALGLSEAERGAQLAALSAFGQPVAINLNSLQEQPQPHSDQIADVTQEEVQLTQAAPQPAEAPVVPTEESVAEPPAAEPETSETESSPVITALEEGTTEPLPYTNVKLESADSDAIVAIQDGAPAEVPEPASNDTLSASVEEMAIARETERAERLLASIEQGLAPVPETDASTTDAPANPAMEVESHLKAWAAAWSAKDVDGYIRAYVAGYKPQTGTSHEQWVRTRTQRLQKPKFINVSLSDIEIDLVSDNRAEITFRQSYRSDRYRDVERKRISMMQRSSGWKIVSEGKL